MRFFEWANARDRGVLQKIADVSGICYPQIHSWYSEARVPKGVNAIRLLRAIRKVDGGGADCAVTLEDLMTPRGGTLPPKRMSKRALIALERARPKKRTRARKVAA